MACGQSDGQQSAASQYDPTAGWEGVRHRRKLWLELRRPDLSGTAGGDVGSRP